MVINSILNQGILFPPEIIVVGDKETCNYLKSKFQIDLKYIEFDESQMPGWITKKKNMITEMALGDYIVYVHDYVTFSQGWHNAVLSFLKKTRVDVAITEILDYKGNRYADWILHPLNYRLTDLLTFPNKCLLPYDEA